MVRSGEGHAARTELERIIMGTVTKDMSLLRSCAWAGSRRNLEPERPQRGKCSGGRDDVTGEFRAPLARRHWLIGL
jgi:hypothetical protein